MITGSLDNIFVERKIDTLFFGKNTKTLQERWQQVVHQVYFAMDREMNGSL